MKREQDRSRPELILEEAGKLTAEKQGYILAAIRGMIFTRSCFLKNGECGKHKE